MLIKTSYQHCSFSKNKLIKQKKVYVFFFVVVLKIKNLVLTYLGKDPLDSLSSCSISSSGLFRTDILIILDRSWPESTKLWAAFRRCLLVWNAEKASVCLKDRHGFCRRFGNPEFMENTRLEVFVWANLTVFNVPHPVIIRSFSSRHFAGPCAVSSSDVRGP